MIEEWLCEYEIKPSLVSEAIDYGVDFEVGETARQRADRIWRMELKERKQANE